VSYISDCVGSVTDSICTTYEIRSESQTLRPGVTATKSRDNVITFGDRNNLDTRVNGGMDEAVDKLSKNSPGEPEDEDESTTVLFKIHEENSSPSPRMNYSSMLEGEKVGS
jgi:hypothetical protein